MPHHKFYQKLLSVKGNGYVVMAKRDLFRTRIVAVLSIAIGIATYFFAEGVLADVLSVIVCVSIGACAAIDGSIGKRISVWPYFDEVIDWQLVEEKSQN